MKRTSWLWIFAVVITLGSVVFQRMTGPSYPVRVSAELPSGDNVSCRLLTSHYSSSDAPVIVPIDDAISSGEIAWRRLNSRDEWMSIPMQRVGETLAGHIPKQPAAGKVAYSVQLKLAKGNAISLTKKPVVIRFKDPVPICVLAPHIAFMFISMLLATRTGLEAIMKRDNSQRLAVLAAVLLFIGGLVLGPIVQKYAFGAYWTGWPFGHDLTDNKTAFAMLAWVLGIWRGRASKNARWWYVAAAAIHLLVYLIPHSVLGSELDFSSDSGTSSLG